MESPSSPAAPLEEADDFVIWDVVEQHLDEAEFQVENFERALDSAVYTLDSLAKGPERFLLAHIDGLVVGGKPVLDRLLVPIVEEPDPANPGRITAASWVLLMAGRLDLFGKLLLHPEGRVRRAATRAGGLAANSDADRWVLAQFGSIRDPFQAAGLLDYAAERRLTPPGPLFAWLQHGNAALVTSAVRAACASDPMAHAAIFEWLLEHQDPAVRDAVLFPSLLTGSPRAWTACERTALKDDSPSRLSVGLYAALGGPVHHGKLAARLTDEKARNACLFGLAFSGNINLVPALLPWLSAEDSIVAKLVAQTIATITGIDLDSPRFRAPTRAPKQPSNLPPPEADPEAQASLPPIEEEELDTPPIPPPEVALPETSSAELHAWWRESGGQFNQHLRLVAGQPFSAKSAAAFLERAPLCLRHTMAQSLTIRSHGQAWLDTRALSSLQYEQMSRINHLSPRPFEGRFDGW